MRELRALMVGVREVIRDVGFDCIGSCRASALRALPEVRAMCASGTCQMHGRNWACPPHCGEIEGFQAQFDGRTECIVVQTVMELEDEFDAETMMEAQRVHAERIKRVVGMLSADASVLVLSAGACAFCDICTCPDEPCRYPEKRLVSMEAAGLMVNDVCRAAGIPYNHGARTIAYTGCVVL